MIDKKIEDSLGEGLDRIKSLKMKIQLRMVITRYQLDTIVVRCWRPLAF